MIQEMKLKLKESGSFQNPEPMSFHPANFRVLNKEEELNFDFVAEMTPRVLDNNVLIDNKD
jgi:hypothetical protein